jgi:1-deoxy-D-xylulose-5-phosphate synthase
MAKAHAGEEGLVQALSAVGLTVALHRVFRAPYEPLLFEKVPWALAHRLLVGQREGFGGPPHPEDIFDVGHGPGALAYARALLEGRRLLGHKGKAVVILEERRPVQKESFEALSQAGAADMPWVLLLAREGGGRSETGAAEQPGCLLAHEEGRAGEGIFLSKEARAEFFGSLGLMVWPTPNGTHLEEIEAVLRQAKAAHKAVVVPVKLP